MAKRNALIGTPPGGEGLQLVRDLIDLCSKHSVNRVRVGDVEIEWLGGSRQGSTTAPVGEGKSAAPAEPFEPDPAMAEPTAEELALWSSNAYATSTAPKK